MFNIMFHLFITAKRKLHEKHTHNIYLSIFNIKMIISNSI